MNTKGLSIFVISICGCICWKFAIAEEFHALTKFPFPDFPECGADTAFELVTGYVYTAPSESLDNKPGTLFLLDCLEACRRNSSCMSINFETGLCVLFKSDASLGAPGLSISQFPVFTFYGQKTCIKGSSKCRKRGWTFERVSGYQINGFTKKKRRASSRQACMELCLQETEFKCRSANYNRATGDCNLNDMDRFTASTPKSFQQSNDNRTEYLENNCIDDTLRMCDFLKLDGRILKTVDAVFQNVSTLEGCRQMCLGGDLQCRTFDWGVTGEDVCRLSHHSAATLTPIQEPYLDSPQTTTYELGSCYNISVHCRATDMVAQVKTNKVFNGKIYAKTKPASCVNDVINSLDFDLMMPYNDIGCNVKREDAGLFTNDIVLQHHDMVVTNLDLGMSVHCQYDLKNKSIGNTANLNVQGDVGTSGSEKANVSSPNVLMKITDKDGEDLVAANVGDALSLRFEILEKDSPYEIFVRELVAMDGLESEILLVDSLGCPTDSTIMGPLTKVDGSGQSLSAPFDAFKFPSSEVVQFKALVTPCLPACEPVNCDIQSYDGVASQRVESLGRRRRRANQVDYTMFTEPDKVIVVQSIRIKDSLSFQRKGRQFADPLKFHNTEAVHNTTKEISLSAGKTTCFNVVGVAVGSVIFLMAQLVLLVAYIWVWQRRRRTQSIENNNKNNSHLRNSVYANFHHS